MVGKVTRKTADKLLENGEKVEKKKRGPRKRNPNSVLRRNARERDRIRNVNDAFDSLRSHVPNGDLVKGRKISKVETLKSAIEYIHALRDILGDRIQPVEFDDKSDAESSTSESEKRIENQVESPESGIHSNETSLDYSLKTESMPEAGPIESIIGNLAPELPHIDPSIFATQFDQPVTSSPSAQPPSFADFENYDFIQHQNYYESGTFQNALSNAFDF